MSYSPTGHMIALVGGTGGKEVLVFSALHRSLLARLTGHYSAVQVGLGWVWWRGHVHAHKWGIVCACTRVGHDAGVQRAALLAAGVAHGALQHAVQVGLGVGEGGVKVVGVCTHMRGAGCGCSAVRRGTSSGCSLRLLLVTCTAVPSMVCHLLLARARGRLLYEVQVCEGVASGRI